MGNTSPEVEERPTRQLSRSVQLEDGTWLVRVAGRHRSGTSPDRGASLLLLFFFDPEDSDTPVREAYAAARELEDLDDEELAELFSRSRPYRSPEETQAGGPAGAGERSSRGKRRRRDRR